MEIKESCANRIISLMFSISRNLRQESQETEIEAAERLSMIQLETLKFIDEHESPPMKDVADYLSIAPPSLTPLIDSLELKSLLRRGPSQQDRRATLIFLTAKGKDVLEKAMRKKMKRMRYVFEKLTKDEQQALVRILEKLSEAPKH